MSVMPVASSALSVVPMAIANIRSVGDCAAYLQDRALRLTEALSGEDAPRDYVEQAVREAQVVARQIDEMTESIRQRKWTDKLSWKSLSGEQKKRLEAAVRDLDDKQKDVTLALLLDVHRKLEVAMSAKKAATSFTVDGTGDVNLYNTEINGRYPHKDHLDMHMASVTTSLKKVAESDHVKISGQNVAMGNAKFT